MSDTYLTVERAPRPKGSSRKAWLPPVLLFILALAVRLAHLYLMRQSPYFLYPIMDSRIHDEWAWSIVSGQNAVWTAPFFRAPLYPYFLAGIYWIFGHSLTLARVAQTILGSMSVVLIFLIGRRVFGSRTAWIGSLSAVFYWMFLYFEGELLIVPLIVFLDLAGLFVFLRALDRPRARSFLLAGLLFGMSAVARPNILLFAIAGAVWLVIVYRKESMRAPLLRTVAFTVGVILPILPVTAANVLSGDFILIASQGGVNFYIGNNPQSDALQAVVPGTRTDWWGGYYDTILIAEKDLGRQLKPSEVSRYWYGRGVDFIRTEPQAAARLFLRKLYLFWNHHEFGNNQDIYFQQSRAPVLRWLSPVGFGLVAPLGLLGMAIGWRRARKSRPLSLFVLVYALSVILFFMSARYRMPVVPILLLFGASAAGTWIDVLRSRRIRQATAMVVPAVLFALVVNSNFHKLEKIHFAFGHYNLGLTYVHAGRFEQAIEEFREALHHDPGRRDASYNLATTLIQTGRQSEAERVLRDALNRYPDDAEAHYAMGSALVSMGNLEEAVQELTHAVSLRPNYFEAHQRLGVALYRQDRLGEAEASFRRALEIHPRFAAAYNNLGIVLARKGNLEAAREMFEETLRLDPAHEGAAENLERLRSNEEGPPG